MPIILTDSETNGVEVLPGWATIYDVLIAIKQLEANRARFRKENRPDRKSYYVPNGKPRGRPKKAVPPNDENEPIHSGPSADS
jgi:hypothetical protein